MLVPARFSRRMLAGSGSPPRCAAQYALDDLTGMPEEVMDGCDITTMAFPGRSAMVI